MRKSKLISLKRIEKDISEINTNPIEGIGIIKYEDDFMKYIVNIKLLNGIYEGYCIQLLLTFTEYYPVKPPKILIFPNQEFGGTYHHHIFPDKDGFRKFCFDLLDNDFMNTNEANTGWNPSYTISSLLLQVQNFLSDPDMSHIPSKEQINYLLNSMKSYERTFLDENGNVIIHTWENPYPPMFGYENKKNKVNEISDKNIKTETKIDLNEEKDKNIKIDDETQQKNENEINNVTEKDKNGNMMTNFFSYIGSFIPSSPFTFMSKKEDNKSIDNNEESEKEEEKLEDRNSDIDITFNEKINNIMTDKNEIINIEKNNCIDINEVRNKLEEEKTLEEERKELEEQKKLEEEKKKLELEKKLEEEKKIEEEKKKRIEEIKQNLSCFLLRVNIIDDKDICLGYPLKQLLALGDKIECVPIPEILSYEGYLSQIAKDDGKLDDYFNISFKAANNENYNYWLPIYINEEHFKRNKTLILNSFSVLKFGAKGQKEYDFKPEHIFEYLPNLLNKMICGMFNEKSYMSEAYIRCYFQYLLLFRKLIDEFKSDFNKYLNEILDNIKKYKYVINKTIVPDLGNFYMLLFFSGIEIDKKIWNALFEESMIRKMYWTFHHFDNEVKSKSIFDMYGNSEINMKLLDLMKKEKLVYYEYLDEIKTDKKYEQDKPECVFTIYERDLNKKENAQPLKGLFHECMEKGIFDKIINIISKEMIKKPKNLNDLFNKEKKYKIDENTRNKVRERIIDEFPSIYKNECSTNAQKKIDKLLISNINLYKYCGHELKENYLNKNNYFLLNKVDELMKKIDKKFHSEIVNKLYDVAKDNLLLITTLAQKKMNEKGFLTELEKNYGLYMNIEEFMKEINQKITEIKCYKDLFDFMKADVVFKVEDEYETIIKSYQKAKEKRYIKTIYTNDNSDSKYELRTANDFKSNNKNKSGGNYKKIHTGDYLNRRNNNRNNNNNHNSNQIRNNTHNSNNNRRRNNFNSHMVDIDELLGD